MDVKFLNFKINHFMNKKIKFLLAAFVMVFVFASCDDKDDVKVDTVIYKAELKGSNEVPSNTSEAKGNSVLTFNKVTKKFQVVTTYSGLTPMGGHIHMAEKGANGAVVFPLGDKLASPITFQSGVLTAEQIKALEDGHLYVNLHTEMYPGGEIRGQLMKQ